MEKHSYHHVRKHNDFLNLHNIVIVLLLIILAGIWIKAAYQKAQTLVVPIEEPTIHKTSQQVFEERVEEKTEPAVQKKSVQLVKNVPQKKAATIVAEDAFLGCGLEGEPCCVERMTKEKGYVWCQDPYTCVGNTLQKNWFTCRSKDSLSKNQSVTSILEENEIQGQIGMQFIYTERSRSVPIASYPLINCIKHEDCRQITLPEAYKKFQDDERLYCDKSCTSSYYENCEGLCLWR